MKKDLSASVRQKLANVAKTNGIFFQEILQRHAMERLLYRVSQSKHKHHFILKGALLFTAWGFPGSRPTKDIDFLACIGNDLQTMEMLFREICVESVEPDGWIFNPKTVQAFLIQEEADYQGLRITLEGTLGNVRISIQIDIGFGDVVTPNAKPVGFPTILEFPAPQILSYPRETVIAEKFEIMVRLGIFNSRMKDYFDIWFLSKHFEFDGATLIKAIENTFKNRRVTIELAPVALSSDFSTNAEKQKQWKGFIRKSHLKDTPDILDIIVQDLNNFLGPLVVTMVANGTSSGKWSAENGWRSY